MELKAFATPMFNTKLDIIREIFTNNPRLYAEIITLNPHILKIIELYEKTLADVTSMIEQRDTETFTELMKKRSMWRS
jgi:prephenate dehydrogenase